LFGGSQFLSKFQEVDEKVLKKAASGDLDAFECVYRSFSDFVYRVAYRIVQNRPDADDVTQDVFVKLYDHLKDFKSRALLSTWIYRITVNTALNTAEKNNRERARREEDERAVERQSVPAEAPLKLGRDDAETELGKILQKISPEQRACLVLRELEGLDYRAIAEVLNIKMNTVRTRLKRAREALAELSRKGAVTREL